MPVVGATHDVPEPVRTAAMPIPPLPVFVATRPEQVPAGLVRVVSVDGSVAGAVATWDHHVTGETINLDAMPPEIDTLAFDGIGTTLADTDAVASAVAVLLGGVSRLPGGVRLVLESASHWCDHLAPRAGVDDETNRRGLALCDAIDDALGDGTHEAISARFHDVVHDLARRIRSDEPLPASDRSERQLAHARAVVGIDRIQLRPRVAIVDLRGLDEVDGTACYALHDRPVAITVELRHDGGTRYTVGVNPRAVDRPTDLRPALEALAGAEYAHGAPALRPEPGPGSENWGGRATVFGSPWNYGSRLAPDEVARTVEGALGWD